MCGSEVSLTNTSILVLVSVSLVLLTRAPLLVGFPGQESMSSHMALELTV